MHDWTRRGEVPLPDPDLAADMYDHAECAMNEVGYVHYEISNWCRPGRECEHNLIYWRNEPYFGLGAGAHGSTITRRRWNVRRPAEYIARVGSGASAEMSGEDIDERTSRGETMILGLRLLEEGVQQERFRRRYGLSIEAAYPDELGEGWARGLIEITPECVRLTPSGRFLSNQVMRTFV
jgi:oxygen-independent coproporphyrinogen-3 oxidase